MTVLIADDSPTMRRIFRGILAGMGHGNAEILEAASGPEAETLLAQTRPEVDLVIADWDLAGLDGLTLLRRLRNGAFSKEIPILFCINRDQRRLVAEALRLGAADFIERPFTDEALREKVGRLEEGVRDRRSKESDDVLRAIVSTAEAEADLPFLVRLPSHLIDEFLKLAVRGRHPPGTVLFRAGEGVPSLHVVTQGEVALLDPEGKPARVCREGDCFGETSFLMSQPARHSACARTPVEVVSLSRLHLGELVRHQPRMAEYLSSLMARHSKALHPGPPTRTESEFTGTLQTMSFADVVQLLGTTQKTGVLGLKEGGLSGGITFEAGEAVHAWTEEVTGEEAFYRMAAWRRARFAFNSVPRKEPRTIHQPTLMLLMEAMRRIDEDRRGTRAPAPGLSA